ncbi:MAG: ribose-phosphate pyrophosphokinase [Clostridiales bacterium]|jgi:ribose-phosphate pyrophosphokinase|nr:ribose-phosphate pyrophosphokinase [Clostridiales bacterium]HOL61327.1 ribose-phosphate pyrophosphokinase [Clostridia bacterium]HPO54024.1 ribose-phosphate pyrophosphokinase [Clostridia bacterium]
MPTFFTSVFQDVSPVAPLGLIVLKGAEELGKQIDSYLVQWYNRDVGFKDPKFKRDTFIIKSQCPRFTTGDGKAIIEESVRGYDLYFIVDVGNYSVKYNMFGHENSMSPDDHYADLKRLISAAGGKAARITVVMPLLYGGRQHRRNSRESLDCAQMLQELFAMGVKDLITFDAHDPRVQNSVPLMGFDNFFPTYQILKALMAKFPDVSLDKDSFMVVSPDEGAMSRNIYYASVLGVDLGMFYKRRDYTNIVNGRNPIVAHEYIGTDVAGKDIFVADDIIATGDSVLRLCRELKEKGCRNIFLMATYALFTEGCAKFDDAYAEGLFTAVLSTNLTYVSEELKSRDWFVCADISKYISYIISSCNQNKSVSPLLNSADRIHELLGR